MFNGFRRFPARDDRGVTGVEYALIAGLVSLVVAGGAAVVGPTLAGAYTSAGTAVSGTGVTEEGEGLCAGRYATEPVTCDPETGTPDTSACPGLAQGDGSLADPWACVAEPTPTPTPTPTETPTAEPTPTPTATPTETPSATPSATPSQTPSATPSATPSQTPSATPSATPSPTPTAYAGATPRSNYAEKFNDGESYALPAIAGIQYAVAGCDRSDDDGCRNYRLSGSTVTVDRDWDDEGRKARLTIRWTIPATSTTLQATGTFTLEMNS